jgi:CBS-domain-containing membrane protein
VILISTTIQMLGILTYSVALVRPSDGRLSEKLVPTFADRGCHVVIVTDPYGRILGFLDRSRNFSIK